MLEGPLGWGSLNNQPYIQLIMWVGLLHPPSQGTFTIVVLAGLAEVHHSLAEANWGGPNGHTNPWDNGGAGHIS